MDCPNRPRSNSSKFGVRRILSWQYVHPHGAGVSGPRNTDQFIPATNNGCRYAPPGLGQHSRRYSYQCVSQRSSEGRCSLFSRSLQRILFWQDRRNSTVEYREAAEVMEPGKKTLYLPTPPLATQGAYILYVCGSCGCFGMVRSFRLRSQRALHRTGRSRKHYPQ